MDAGVGVMVGVGGTTVMGGGKDGSVAVGSGCQTVSSGRTGVGEGTYTQSPTGSVWLQVVAPSAVPMSAKIRATIKIEFCRLLAILPDNRQEQGSLFPVLLPENFIFYYSGEGFI